jgi:rod shape-determining protein MreD
LTLVLGLIQVSFLTTWPVPVCSLNLILCLVIFITVIISYEKGLYLAFGSGLFLELYSALPFGLTSLGLLVMVVLTNQLFKNFFTNRSFYSLVILGFIATFLYNFIVLALSLIFVVFGFKFSFAVYDFRLNFFWQPLLNVLILSIFFFTYYLSTGRIKNLFIFPSDFYGAKKHF